MQARTARIHGFARIVFISAAGLAFAGTQSAQSSGGAPTPFVQDASSATGIQVRATDPTGALIRNAFVSVTNQAARETAKGATTEYGEFRAVDLAPGAYVVTVESSGFVTSSQHAVVLEGRLSRIAAVMQIQVGGHHVMVDHYHGLLYVGVDPTNSSYQPFDLGRRTAPALIDVDSTRPAPKKDQPAKP